MAPQAQAENMARQAWAKDMGRQARAEDMARQTPAEDMARQAGAFANPPSPNKLWKNWHTSVFSTISEFIGQ